MAKVAPAREAPQNILPFSERTENSHWLRSEAPEGINGRVDWPRKLSSRKLSIKGNTRSFENL